MVGLERAGDRRGGPAAAPTTGPRASSAPSELGGIGAPAPVLGASLRRARRRSPSARLYATAHGVYEAALNGRRVGDEVLAPGWTSYRNRLRYQTYDVTGLVRDGRERARGPARQRLVPRAARLGPPARALRRPPRAARPARGDDRRRRGPRPRDRRVVDGARERRARRRPLRRPADRPAPAAARSRPARSSVVDADLARLVAPDGPPVRVTETLPAVEVLAIAVRRDARRLRPEPRRLGAADASATARAGDEVVVRHAEVLEDGELGVRPLRTAKATDTLRARRRRARRSSSRASRSTASATPRSPACRTCAPRTSRPSSCGSDLRRTGWFESSDELLNRFHENVVWGMRGNFLDVPTDCPQRDERLGWTGDIQVFAPRRDVPVRHGGLPALLARRPRRRAAARTAPCPFVDPGRHWTRDGPAAAGVGRRRDDRAVGRLPARRRRDAARPPAAEHARVGRPRRGAGRARPPVDRRLPVRRLARPDRAARRAVQGAGRPRRRRHRVPRALGRGRRGSRRTCSAASTTPSATPGSPPRCAARSRASTSPAAGAS